MDTFLVDSMKGSNGIREIAVTVVVTVTAIIYQILSDLCWNEVVHNKRPSGVGSCRLRFDVSVVDSG